MSEKDYRAHLAAKKQAAYDVEAAKSAEIKAAEDAAKADRKEAARAKNEEKVRAMMARRGSEIDQMKDDHHEMTAAEIKNLKESKAAAAQAKIDEERRLREEEEEAAEAFRNGEADMRASAREERERKREQLRNDAAIKAGQQDHEAEGRRQTLAQTMPQFIPETYKVTTGAHQTSLKIPKNVGGPSKPVQLVPKPKPVKEEPVKAEVLLEEIAKGPAKAEEPSKPAVKQYDDCGQAPRGPQHVGRRVDAESYGKGTIRYFGPHKRKKGLRVGVELDQQMGLNDGSTSEDRYFTCKPKFGILVVPAKCVLIGDDDF